MRAGTHSKEAVQQVHLARRPMRRSDTESERSSGASARPCLPGTDGAWPVVGKHLFLRCDEWEGAPLLAGSLPAVVPLLGIQKDIWVELSKAGCKTEFGWS